MRINKKMNGEAAYNKQFGAMAAVTTQKMQCEMQVCRPQESTWKPPLPQYAGRCMQDG